jgi:hypothetical protein
MCVIRIHSHSNQGVFEEMVVFFREVSIGIYIYHTTEAAFLISLYCTRSAILTTEGCGFGTHYKTFY